MTNSSSLKIAIAQQCAVDDFDENMKVVCRLIEEASEKDSEIIFFPENCLYVRLDKKVLPPYLQLDSKYFKQLENLASDKDIAIHLGGVGIEEQASKFNASIFIEPGKNSKVTYRKQKLFDIDLPGKHSYRESDAYQHGSKSEVLEYKSWKFGQSICYDLRFSEIYSNYANQKVDAILVPSSFLVPTGEAHWHILNRARAVESQTYVIASAQSGNHKDKHQSYGHSLVVDPWGVVLEDLEKSEDCIAIVDLKKDRITQIRENMPMR